MSTVGDMWDRRFSEQAWLTEPDPLLVELAASLPVGRALDLGSGPGRNSLWLACLGWTVTAVDASQVALTQAAQQAKKLGVALATIHADVTVWQPTSGAFDLIVVANLHPGIEALSAVLAGAADALVPGGHLFVIGHDVVNLGRHGPPDSSRLLSIERLSEAMPPVVAIEKLERRIRPPDGTHSEDLSAQDVAVLAWATKRH